MNIEQMFQENKTFNSLFNAALSLIEDGISTPETAFIDLRNRQMLHFNSMFQALQPQLELRERTGYNEVYDDIINKMAHEVYNKIKSNPKH